LIVDVTETQQDKVLWYSTRPNTLDEFIGQERAVRELRYAVEGAQRRREAIEPILLWGPPGLGKTSLARCLSQALFEKDPVEFVGGLGTGDLFSIFSGEGERVIVLDEIHAMTSAQKTALLSVIEEGRFFHPSWMEWVQLDNLTIVAITTRMESLPAPLRDRFTIPLRLEYYSTEEMVNIVKRAADILNLELDEEGYRVVAERSRGTPRLANRFLKRLKDRGDTLNHEQVIKAFEELDIDEHGLTSIDRQYLKLIISSPKPVGLNTLANSLGESPRSVSEFIEPYLTRMGLVVVSKQGRIPGPNTRKERSIVR
jgi:Holliday junction DNA helicase RuvB